MAFQGWLIKFGDTVLPNKYLTGYKDTPNQRLELAAYRDTEALLHRETSPNFKSKIVLSVRELLLGEKIVFKAIVDSGLVLETERRVAITYWNSEEMEYKTGIFYMPDIEYEIKHVSESKLNMLYSAFQIELIEY